MNKKCCGSSKCSVKKTIKESGLQIIADRETLEKLRKVLNKVVSSPRATKAVSEDGMFEIEMTENQ